MAHGNLLGLPRGTNRLQRFLAICVAAAGGLVAVFAMGQNMGVRYAAHVALGDLQSDFVPEAVPYAVLTPHGGDPGPFPLCIVLHGGGGSRRSEIDVVHRCGAGYFPGGGPWWAAC